MRTIKDNKFSSTRSNVLSPKIISELYSAHRNTSKNDFSRFFPQENVFRQIFWAVLMDAVYTPFGAGMVSPCICTLEYIQYVHIYQFTRALTDIIVCYESMRCCLCFFTAHSAAAPINPFRYASMD